VQNLEIRRNVVLMGDLESVLEVGRIRIGARSGVKVLMEMITMVKLEEGELILFENKESVLEMRDCQCKGGGEGEVVVK